MPYLISPKEIRAAIAEFATAKTLWLDTEVADYKSKNPKLSLIQVLANPHDMTGNSTYLLDVLDKSNLIADFINVIMSNPDIEKVFHNAKYDQKFLGKDKVKNITCTWELAKSIPYYLLPLPDYQLKTLATKLCNFHNIDKQSQTSDWGQRPLTEEQIEYAYLDCIYLAQVHFRLLELTQQTNPEPAEEDLTLLDKRYQEIEQQWKLLQSEMEHLEERVKKAMQAQNLTETSQFKLTSYQRSTVKVSFTELAKLVETQGIELDFPVTLTQKLQKDLGGNLEQLPVEVETTNSVRLTPKVQTSEGEDS